MNTQLKDLVPGDEFEYADTDYAYRKGKFLVLNTDGGYLAPAATVNGRFLYSYEAKKVVNHYVELIVNVIKEATVKLQKEMGYFIGWKFGVPVRILNIRGAEVYHFMYLIDETDRFFTVLSKSGRPEVLSKLNRSYELIPYKYGDVMSPRYPVCVTPEKTAFCNVSNHMATLDASTATFKRYPTAKLILEDGTEIILSGETTEALRQQFGR